MTRKTAAIVLLVALFVVVVLQLQPEEFWATHNPPPNGATSLGQRYAFAIHPTHHAVAYIFQSGSNYKLAIQTADGQTFLLKELGDIWRNIQLAWSPNGRSLVAMWRSDYALITLFEFEPATLQLKSEQILANSPRYQYGRLSWLNNNQLVITRALVTQSDFSLFTFSLNSLEFTHYPNGEHVRYVASDNGHVAFVQYNEGNQVVRVIDPSGNEIQQHEIIPDITDLTFLPNLEGLLFITAKGPLVLFKNGMSLSPDFSQYGKLSSPKFSSDGQALYFLHYQQNLDLWQRAAKAEIIPNTRLIATPAQEYSAVCHSTSSQFFYVSNRSGITQIWMQDGNESRQLTQFSQEAQIQTLRVSFNGEKIAFRSDKNIMLYDVLTHEIRTLFQNAPNIEILGFDQDGMHLFYSYRFENTGSFDAYFWKHSFATGKNEKLPIPIGRKGIVSKGELYVISKQDNHLYKWHSPHLEKLPSIFQSDTNFITQNATHLFYTLPRPNQRRQIWAYNKSTSQHTIIIQRHQYVGTITDICDDGIALLHHDINDQLELYRTSYHGFKQQAAWLTSSH